MANNNIGSKRLVVGAGYGMRDSRRDILGVGKPVPACPGRVFPLRPA